MVNMLWNSWQRWVITHVQFDEQLQTQFANTRRSVLVGSAAALVPAVYYWKQQSQGLIALWVLALIASFGLRIVLQNRFSKQSINLRAELDSKFDNANFFAHWAALYALIVGLSGLLWGMSMWIFQVPGNFADGMVALSTLAGAALSGMLLFSAFYPALLTFSMGIFLPAALAYALQNSQQALAHSVLCLLLLVFLLAEGRKQSQSAVHLIRMQREKEKLVGQLTLENAAKEQALLAAQEATAAKTRFFAAVSHDLRQPLYSLSLLAGTAANVMPDVQRHNLQHNMQQSVAMLDGLFTQLLEVSQLDAGALEPQIQTIKLATFMQEIAQVLEVQFKQKGIALQLETADANILADRAWLQRIVFNLIGNAINHAPDNNLRFFALIHVDHVLLGLQDYGPGIAADQQEKIFEEFYRMLPKKAAPGSETQHKGFGLGLPIVRRLARAMGSDVQVQSVVGQGSTFSLRLPLVKPPYPNASLPDEPGQGASLLQGMCVGVLEDDESVGAALVELLESWGMQVQWARCSDQALAWPEPLRALIVDYRLSSTDTMNGAQTAQALQRKWLARQSLRQPQPQPLPLSVLIVSSLQLDSEQRLDFDAVTKPLAPIKLRAWLLHALRAENTQTKSKPHPVHHNINPKPPA